ncbi:MAG: hypothetical protein R3279_12705 [Putridiphycobacter sp.]|jgi:hypothetical protein|nr:hypothetical protein [Putridiphycobacter sp.]
MKTCFALIWHKDNGLVGLLSKFLLTEYQRFTNFGKSGHSFSHLSHVIQSTCHSFAIGTIIASKYAEKYLLY